MFREDRLVTRFQILIFATGLSLFSGGQNNLNAANDKVSEIFELGKQAVVLGREPFMNELVLYDNTLRQRPRLFPRSIKPGQTMDRTRGAAYTNNIQYVLLSPYHVYSPIHQKLANHNFYYDLVVRNMELYEWLARLDLGFRYHYSQVRSTDLVEREMTGYGPLAKSQRLYGFASDTGVSIGSNHHGKIQSGITLFEALSWKSNFFFDISEYQDPTRLYIDPRGNIKSLETTASRNQRFSVIDDIELPDIGLKSEILYKQNKLWQFNAADYINIEETIYFEFLRTFLTPEYTTLEGNQYRFYEPGVGFLLSRGDGPDDAHLGFSTISFGARLKEDTGEFYAARGSLMIVPFKLEVTYQNRDKFGNRREIWGGGVGFGSTLEGALAEMAYHYNYLNHLDQVQRLQDLHFFKINLQYKFQEK